jgi:hypothetical protein
VDILAFYDRHMARTGDVGRRQGYLEEARSDPAVAAAIIRSRDNLDGLYLEEHEVEVSTAGLVVDHDDVKVWEIDLVTKYADVFGCGGDVVALSATKHSIRVNEAERGTATQIRLGLPTAGNWSLIAQCARYTCQIAAYRQSVEELSAS